MKLLKNTLKLLLVLVLAYGLARFVVVYHDSRLSGERAPYIQSLASTSVVIHWMTDSNQLGVVHYGIDAEHMAKVVLESSPTRNHIVTITGLKPATRYYYQVGALSGFQPFDPEKNWFYTAPLEEVATRIWVIGDSGEAGDTLYQVRDAAFEWMQKNPPIRTETGPESEDSPAEQNSDQSDRNNDRPLINVWLALGDIAYRSGSNQQFQQALFEPFADLLPNTAIWPVYGNHDDRRWTYFRIFDLPQYGEAGGVPSGTENYYAFDYSNIHFVVLDSQASDRDVDGDMLTWLQQDLAQNSKEWLIVAFHHPPYSKGSHNSDSERDSRGRMRDMRENVLPVLEQAGVDLVLSGHSHMYERSYLIDCAYAPSTAFSELNIVSRGVEKENRHYIKPLENRAHQGTVYIVAGSSAKVDQGELDHPAHAVGLMEAGSVVIDVLGNKLTARFINNRGEVRDEFSITKKPNYKSEYQGCQSG